MDHSVHWGYSSASNHQESWIHNTRGIKRGYSESDGDELYSEESSKEQNSPGAGVGNCQLLNRKKRRGVIEKKRRDRINNSLSELKRLVPSAYEKQGSTKLEKAEILQLTVEHLKNLNAKGIDGSSCDQSRFALDYHIIGFRECAAEVARYLVTIEGMDIQDPLRLRLMSHLQYFVQQRELTAKSTAAASQVTASWPVNAYHQTANMHSPYQPYPIQGNASTPYVQPVLSHHSTSSATSYAPSANPHSMPVPSTIHGEIESVNTILNPIEHHSTSQQQQQHSTNITAHHQSVDQLQIPVSNSSDTNTSRQLQTQQQEQTQPAYVNHHHQQQQQSSADPTYTELTTLTRSPTDSYALSQYVPNNGQDYATVQNTNYTTNHSNKPYRPWGAELAY